MSELFHEMLSFIIEKEVGFGKKRAERLAGHFADTNEFLTVTEDQLREIRSVGGRRAFIFQDEEIAKIIEVSRSGLLDPNLSNSKNFLSTLCRSFTKTQLEMIRSLHIDDIIPNPFLIKSLNLNTPQLCIAFNIYARATRSIVTSMGYYTEKFLLASSDTLEEAPDPWDLIKTRSDGSRYWIQVKSGPNDMDKDQIEKWAEYIAEKIESGDSAYIGISYGKRSDVTVTSSLFSRYLPNNEDRTLIGRELWDFVTDDPTYLGTLFETLVDSARRILSTRSINDEINLCIERNVQAFIERYGEGEVGINNYIDHIF
jgi:hypothetical protein